MYRHLPSATDENLPVATKAAEQILCLPFYHDLAEDDQMRLVEALRLAGSRTQRVDTAVRL